jgi:hypothetical protein
MFDFGPLGGTARPIYDDIGYWSGAFELASPRNYLDAPKK